MRTTFTMCRLEDLARKDNIFSRMPSSLKIIIALTYAVVISLVSGKNPEKVAALLAYPAFAIIAIDFPIRYYLPHLALASFAAGWIGIADLIIDTESVKLLGIFMVTKGFISFAVIIIKAIMAFIAALILASTTPLEKLATGLNTLGMPSSMASVVMLIVRYARVLVSEVQRSVVSYRLRGGNSGRIEYYAWGSFTGQILIRAVQSSKTLSDAMKMRGFDNDIIEDKQPLKAKDYLKFAGVELLIILPYLLI